MPKQATRSSGRVSKSSQSSTSLNEKNVAALECEIDAPGEQSGNGQNSRSASSGRTTSKPLDDAQEDVLIRWIQRVKDMSHIPTTPQVKSTISQIQPGIGNAAVDRVIKGLPEDLKPARSRATKQKRLESSDLGKLRQWFDKLEKTIGGVSPANIYNFDETNFQIGNGYRPQYFVGRYGLDIPLQRTYCSWITTIECLAADGWALDPCIVVQSECFYENWFENKGNTEDSVFMVNSSGRITEEVTYGWIEFFHRLTKDRIADGESRVLLFRGEPQHLTFGFLQFCDQHNIIPICFPTKMGHLMQPFDLKAFASYKNYWKHKCHYFPYVDVEEEQDKFLEGFFVNREKCLKPCDIKNAFAAQGISPIDPSKILEPFQ